MAQYKCSSRCRLKRKIFPPALINSYLWNLHCKRNRNIIQLYFCLNDTYRHMISTFNAKCKGPNRLLYFQIFAFRIKCSIELLHWTWYKRLTRQLVMLEKKMSIALFLLACDLHSPRESYWTLSVNYHHVTIHESRYKRRGCIFLFVSSSSYPMPLNLVRQSNDVAA